MPTSDRSAGGFGAVVALERGLATIAAFTASRPELTVSDVAREVGIDRSTARRMLLTLVDLGLVMVDEQIYRLHPSCLRLGRAYLDGLAFPELALPHLRRLSDLTQESALAGVLDGDEFVVVSRVPAPRLMSAVSGLGTRFPATTTAGGLVLLADRPATGPVDEDLLSEVRRRGYAVNDELLVGVRSIATALRDADGTAIGAVVVSGHASRCSVDTLTTEFLPHLRRAVAAIEAADRTAEGASPPARP